MQPEPKDRRKLINAARLGMEALIIDLGIQNLLDVQQALVPEVTVKSILNMTSEGFEKIKHARRILADIKSDAEFEPLTKEKIEHLFSPKERYDIACEYGALTKITGLHTTHHGLNMNERHFQTMEKMAKKMQTKTLQDPPHDPRRN